MACTLSPYCVSIALATLSSIASSSTCAPIERRSVATSAVPPTAPATTSGTQPVSSVAVAVASSATATAMDRIWDMYGLLGCF